MNKVIIGPHENGIPDWAVALDGPHTSTGAQHYLASKH